MCLYHHSQQQTKENFGWDRLTIFFCKNAQKHHGWQPKLLESVRLPQPQPII